MARINLGRGPHEASKKANPKLSDKTEKKKLKIVFMSFLIVFILLASMGGGLLLIQAKASRELKPIVKNYEASFSLGLDVYASLKPSILYGNKTVLRISNATSIPVRLLDNLTIIPRFAKEGRGVLSYKIVSASVEASVGYSELSAKIMSRNTTIGSKTGEKLVLDKALWENAIRRIEHETSVPSYDKYTVTVKYNVVIDVKMIDNRRRILALSPVLGISTTESSLIYDIRVANATRIVTANITIPPPKKDTSFMLEWLPLTLFIVGLSGTPISAYGYTRTSRREKTVGEVLEWLGAYSADLDPAIPVVLIEDPKLVPNLAKKTGRPLIYTIRNGEELVCLVLEGVAHCTRIATISSKN